jgi:hypothetical protein
MAALRPNSVIDGQLSALWKLTLSAITIKIVFAPLAEITTPS